MKPTFECCCDKCKGACKFNPGWFMPGEAEEVAAHLNVSLKKLFDTKLGVNWWEDTGDGDIFLLAPALVGLPTGEEYPGDPRGTCIFYKDEKCEIHPVKPFECAMLQCDSNQKDVHKQHGEVAIAWQDHQEQIIGLLGRMPLAEAMLPFFSPFSTW